MSDFDFSIDNSSFIGDTVDYWQQLDLYDCASSLLNSAAVVLSPVVSLFSPVWNYIIDCVWWYLQELALAEDHVYGHEYVSNYVPKPPRSK